ncbi:MAG: hypothetical protein HQK51_11480 [Oligoflexia bacterium]|nr:hypothetical protein [Oligoflexia bacterium]
MNPIVKTMSLEKDLLKIANVENNCAIPISKKSIFNNCVQDHRGNVKYALLGDSKASALFPGLLKNSSSNRWMFIGNFAPVISDSIVYKHLKQTSELAIDFVAKNKNIEVVVLTTAVRNLFQLPANSDQSIEALPSSLNYEVAFDGLKNTVEKFTKYGKKIVITVDNPTLPNPRDCLDRTTAIPLINNIFNKYKNSNCNLSYTKHLELSKQYLTLLLKLKELYPFLEIYDPAYILCDIKNDLCPSFRNNNFLYSYSDHISNYSNNLIGKEVISLIENIQYKRIYSTK